MLATLKAAGLPPVWVEVRGPRGSTRAPNTYRAVRAALEPLGYEPYFWSPSWRKCVHDVRGREDVLFLHPTRPPRSG